MPRYFISTPDDYQAHDDGGVILSGPDELAQVLRQTLAARIHDEGGRANAEFVAQAHDEHGRRVMAARISMRTHEP